MTFEFTSVKFDRALRAMQEHPEVRVTPDMERDRGEIRTAWAVFAYSFSGTSVSTTVVKKKPHWTVEETHTHIKNLFETAQESLLCGII